MRLFPAALCLSLAYRLAAPTLSRTDPGRSAAKTLREKTGPSERTVQERGLVTSEPRAEDVVREHRRPRAPEAARTHFAGDALGYVTPWNGGGYDAAETFGAKFSWLSPVWLQVKRRGRELFQVTGLHDVDQGWLRDVRKAAPRLRVVPRVLFEGWTPADFEAVFHSEDELDELGQTLLSVAKSENFDGFVIEVWSQLGSQKANGSLIHSFIQSYLLSTYCVQSAVLSAWKGHYSDKDSFTHSAVLREAAWLGRKSPGLGVRGRGF
uniref:Chitinase domain-containing protein 1 n=1 Tax=Ornithorhynchus anatinus TaxID=9258 RepID=A0A6I8N2U5_ORNAN